MDVIIGLKRKTTSKNISGMYSLTPRVKVEALCDSYLAPGCWGS